MRRYFAITLLLAACSGDSGDDPAPDGMALPGPDAPADPSDGANPGDGPANGPSDAEQMDPRDAGDRLADIGPDLALPDAAPMVAMGLNVGQQAPDFTLPDANGDEVSLSDFRGNYALVVGTSVW